MHEISRFQHVDIWLTDHCVGVVVFTRADLSDVPPSEEHSGDEPSECAASHRNTNAHPKRAKEGLFSHKVEDLEDTDDDVGDVDDEPKHEPVHCLGLHSLRWLSLSAKFKYAY